MDSSSKTQTLSVIGASKEMVSGDVVSLMKRSTSLVESVNSEGERPVQYRKEFFTMLPREGAAKPVKNSSKPKLAELAEQAYARAVAGDKRAGSAADFSHHLNAAVTQAALGGSHWPPYLLIVWMFILVLSHVLHSLRNLLVQFLPRLRNMADYARNYTEQCWLDDSQSYRIAKTLNLAVATSGLYSAYFTLFALHMTTAWLLDPLAMTERGKSKTSSGEDVSLH